MLETSLRSLQKSLYLIFTRVDSITFHIISLVLDHHLFQCKRLNLPSENLSSELNAATYSLYSIIRSFKPFRLCIPYKQEGINNSTLHNVVQRFPTVHTHTAGKHSRVFLLLFLLDSMKSHCSYLTVCRQVQLCCHCFRLLSPFTLGGFLGLPISSWDCKTMWTHHIVLVLTSLDA